MKEIIVFILVNTISLFIISKFMRGIQFVGTGSIVGVSIVLGILNTFIKPILNVIFFPVEIISLGLFSVIINALVLHFAFGLTANARSKSFFTTLIASILLGIINGFLLSLF